MRCTLPLILAALTVGGTGAALAQAPKLDGTRPLDDPLVCLARSIYFEARGRSIKEMTAVGFVVVNRARDTEFPDDICAVIKEGGEEPPCQFNWWCDGRSDIATNKLEYNRTVKVARGILDGTAEDPTNGANMFHNRQVKPAWAKVASPRGRIGAHYFYFLDDR